VLKQVELDRGVVIVEQRPASAEDHRVDEEHQLVEQTGPQQVGGDGGTTDADVTVALRA
jgi:hypothetical protein